MSNARKKSAADCLFPPWNCPARHYKNQGLAFAAHLKSDLGSDPQELTREQQEDQKKANSLCKKVIGLEKKDSL